MIACNVNSITFKTIQKFDLESDRQNKEGWYEIVIHRLTLSGPEVVIDPIELEL